MPMKWTSDNDQRLLLLILEQVQKLDCAKLAAAWKAKYPSQEQPTARAVSEHIGVLRKSNGGTNVNGNGTTPAKTPKKTPAVKKTVTKTPTTSGKRKRTTMSEEDDDDDDSEAERNLLKFPPLGARSSISRRSKSARPSYAEEDADDENGEAVNTPVGPLDFSGATAGVQQGMEKVGFRPQSTDSYGQTQVDGEAARAKGKRVKAESAVDDDSDVSDFQPGFGF